MIAFRLKLSIFGLFFHVCIISLINCLSGDFGTKIVCSFLCELILSLSLMCSNVKASAAIKSFFFFFFCRRFFCFLLDQAN